MLRLVSESVVQPTATVATGGLVLRVADSVGALSIAIPGSPFAAPQPMTAIVDGSYLFSGDGFVVGIYTATVTDAGGPLTLSATFQIIGRPTVDAVPPALAAAHLPMPVVLRAEPLLQPDGALAPSALLLVVEVLRGTAWQEAGRLREVADAALGTAFFDVSEYVKTQFAPTPPDESGDPDPALAIRYRVRYGRLPTFDGAAGTEAGTVAGLAVNAAEVVNPGGDALPLAIGPVPPYATAPTGYARFRSAVVQVLAPAGTPAFASDPASYVYNAGDKRVGPVADATGDQLFERVTQGPAAAPATVAGDANWRYLFTGPVGVANLPAVPAAAAPCPVRQFVWLTRRGAWAWGLFTGRHEHGTDTADDTLVRRAGGDYYVGGGDVRETLKVYSDKLDWSTFQVLREVRRSRRVYERLASGLYVPVLVEKGSFPDYQETDKTFEVNFTVRYPVLTVQTF